MADFDPEFASSSEEGSLMSLSFRSAVNVFTCGSLIEAFPISSMGMHSLLVSVTFEKNSLNCSRKKHPRHLLPSVCTDKTCIRTGTLTELKAALAKPVLIQQQH